MLRRAVVSAIVVCVLIIIIINFAAATSSNEDNCVLYDHCHKSETGKWQLCLHDGLPKRGLLTTEAHEIMLKRCWDIYNTTESPVCCSSVQIVEMEKQFAQLETMVGRCHTCFQNMLKLFCASTCAPNHRQFVEVAELSAKSRHPAASATTVYVDESYLTATFESCKDVITPSFGRKFLGISCGSETEESCTVKKWYEFFGDSVNNRMTPFNIAYTPSNRSGRYTWTTKQCNEAYAGFHPCSCADCSLSCTEKVQIIVDNENFHRVAGFVSVTFATLALLATIAFLTKITSFRKLGIVIARYPVVVLVLGAILIGGLSHNFTNVKVTTDPVKLWSAPNSRARLEKEFFDDKFEPFFRTQQIFLKPKDLTEVMYIDTDRQNREITFGPAFDKNFLIEVFKLQLEIENLVDDDGFGIEKSCFSPLTDKKPRRSQCMVQSLFGYFQNDLEDFVDSDQYLYYIDSCLKNPYDVNCLAPWGGPPEPFLVVGGSESDPNLATGLIMTFLLKNTADVKDHALKWEKRFTTFLSNYSNDLFDFAFIAERSIEDHIEEMSNAEIYTVIIGYIVMFIYIMITLGCKGNFHFMWSQVVLAFGGILIVMSSVAGSLGFFQYWNVETTWLTIEVVPFLILAVGVDNIFLLVRTFEQFETGSVTTRIGLVLDKVGPSIFLTSFSETCCFAIGILVEMPAVKTFAMYATVALFLNFILQITAFVALMALTEKLWNKKTLDEYPVSRRGIVYQMFDSFYMPALKKRTLHWIVMLVFGAWTTASIVLIPSIKQGLDQSLAMPKNSYVEKYFQFMEDYLYFGPPVYFVVNSTELDMSKVEDQNLFCGGIMCNPDSIYMQIYSATKDSKMTSIKKVPSSWIDDYFDYLRVKGCCKGCKREFLNETLQVRPTRDTFNTNLAHFLTDVPNVDCAKAGGAAYRKALHFTPREHNITAFYFMSYHTPLLSSKDFYTSLERARLLSDKFTGTLHGHGKRQTNVFPYSIFYIFYEQYLTIWYDTIICCGLSISAIFVVTALVTRTVSGVKTAALVTFIIAMMVINILGIMSLWCITLNAISLVNVVVCIGIGVEFVSHTVYAYFKTPGTHETKMKDAVVSTGSCVLTGITFTKIVGIIVLAFARSQIFQVFYFRMYLTIVLVGAAHGLILLPVILENLKPKNK